MSPQWPLMTLVLALAVCAPSAAAVSPPDNPKVSGLAPGIDLTSAEALGWTPEQHETALRYSRGGWALWLTGSLLGMAAPFLLAFSGLAGRIEQAVSARLRARVVSDAVCVLAFVSLLALLNLPIEVWHFYRERHYGFATQGLAPWLGDEMKAFGVACVAALIFLLPVWGAIRLWPRGWWVIGSVIGVAFSIAAIAVAPVFIAPLFNTFTPLKDASLKGRILDMAHREGISVDDVFEVDASRQSRHDNAYVVGLLGTQRIVLYDTLIAGYTPEEVQFVMGHEMGHYVLEHIWKGVAFAALAIVAGFFLLHRLLHRIIGRCSTRLGYTSPAAIAAVPLVLLLFSAYAFALQPIESAFSRYVEHEADVFGLDAIRELPESRGVAVSAFQKMAARNLSDPNPPAIVEWWLYSHPSMGNRIRFAAGR